MTKYFTKSDIMYLLCVTDAQFRFVVIMLKLPVNIECQKRYYTIEDIIKIYNYINRKKPKRYIKLVESKMNNKNAKL